MSKEPQLAAFSTVYPNLGHVLSLYGVEAKQLSASYPRIVKIIDSTWGSIDCLHYLNSLLFSERSDRLGFPSNVLDEIVFIKNIFEFSHPQFAVSRDDPIANNKIAEIREHIKEVVDNVQRSNVLSAFPESLGSSAKAPVLNEKKPREEIDSHQSLHQHIMMMEHNAYPRGRHRELLGKYFVEAHILSETTLADALNLQSKLRTRHLLGEILIADHSINEAQLHWALSMQRAVPIVDVSNFEISTEAVRLIPLKIAQAKRAMPIMTYDNHIVVAVENPFDSEVQRYFSFLSGNRAILVYSRNEQIDLALNAYSESKHGAVTHTELSGAKNDHQAPTSSDAMHAESSKKQLKEGLNGVDRVRSATDAIYRFDEDDLDEQSDDFSDQGNDALSLKKIDENDETVIGLINKTIHDAIRFGASDIHLEAFPRTRNSQIRLRKDGKLEVSSTYPISFHGAVVSRVKIMASLDISEKRKAQDGKITFAYANKKLDLRVSTIPTSNGLEVVTVRILGAGTPLPLSKIGLHPESLGKFKQQINKPHGLILVCGPTGSGKTTTLHSVLRELNNSEKKIWTAEDPVEIVQKNISQVQVLPKIGWTFAKALRSFLRADPDVIMVGEIRDSETAKVAVEASMTGHLVLSTLHTNSAAETLMRMMDLEVPAFNLADATQAILSQRLVRRICAECAERYEFTAEDLDQLVNEYTLNSMEKSMNKQERQKLIALWQTELGENAHLFGRRGLGCEACHGTGYKGRMGIHELLVMSKDMSHLLIAGASSSDIFKLAVKEGMKTLRQDAIEKVLQGITDLAEIRLVCI